MPRLCKFEKRSRGSRRLSRYRRCFEKPAAARCIAAGCSRGNVFFQREIQITERTSDGFQSDDQGRTKTSEIGAAGLERLDETSYDEARRVEIRLGSAGMAGAAGSDPDRQAAALLVIAGV